MSKLYIMCGLAFAGKSTLARRIAKYTDSKLIAFDKLWVKKEKDQPISKDAKGWQFIRKVAQDEILKCLREGTSVVYDDNSVRFEHREELRQVAKEAGSDSIVIYLNTPLEIIRAREQANKATGERHEVEPENFQTVLEQLEPPSSNESVLEYKPSTDIGEFLKRLGLMGSVHFKPASDFSELANKIFEVQKARIILLLPYADVQHIGGTAIPNSITKGDLDLIIRVSKDEFKRATKELKSIYDINQPDNWSDTFASFKDDKNLGIDFGAQLVVKGSESDDFVELRDVLLNNSYLVQELNSIKLKYEGKSMEDYRKEKADFFQKLREKFL